MSATEWLVQLGCMWAVFLVFAFIDLPTIVDRAVAQMLTARAFATEDTEAT